MILATNAILSIYIQFIRISVIDTKRKQILLVNNFYIIHVMVNLTSNGSNTKIKFVKIKIFSSYPLTWEIVYKSIFAKFVFRQHQRIFGPWVSSQLIQPRLFVRVLCEYTFPTTRNIYLF